MPTARRSRTINGTAEDLWQVVRDPHHLPRWWPRVTRVEDVRDGAFTEVFRTSKGRTVRADFEVLACDDRARTLTWSQRVEGTPFAHMLAAAETEISLVAPTAREPSASEARAEATEVTIELRQEIAARAPGRGLLLGLTPRLGSPFVRRAALATIDEALDGLERLGG